MMKRIALLAIPCLVIAFLGACQEAGQGAKGVTISGQITLTNYSITSTDIGVKLLSDSGDFYYVHLTPPSGTSGTVSYSIPNASEGTYSYVQIELSCLGQKSPAPSNTTSPVIAGAPPISVGFGPTGAPSEYYAVFDIYNLPIRTNETIDIDLGNNGP